MKTFILLVLFCIFAASWAKENNENYIGNAEILMKQEDASEFHRGLIEKRTIHEECYNECCSFEEVREAYGANHHAAQNYWNAYNDWNKSSHHCCKA